MGNKHGQGGPRWCQGRERGLLTPWDSGGDPRLEVSPTNPEGPPVSPCASVLGAWGLLAQLSNTEILSLAPLRLPSPPPGVTLPPVLFWNLGSCVKVAGRGFREL